MCTMTWFVKTDGYELFFNRDESVLRRHADLPSTQCHNGVQYISPTDTDAGGTWITVNHHGITVCLLNHYQFEQLESYKDWISRGEIVRQFADTSDIGLAEKHFSSLLLNDYRAFRMFIINPQGENILCVWDGHSLRIERNVSTPKSSSSIDAKHVKSLRRELFSDFDLPTSQNSQDYLQFHASHLPSKSKESVCMHRPEATTVSMSHVNVTQSKIEFCYADGPPCEAELGDAVSIARLDKPSVDALALAATL